ncbi:MAG: hypothetical protein ACRDM8_06060 [Gaiellaceae bacterium]
MRRQRLSWLLFVPLTAIGGLVAHVAVQAVAVPAHHGARMPHSHIDIGHWPLCAAVCGVVGLAGLALAGVRGRPARVPLWVFALVPPVGFAVQEEIFALSQGLATPSAGLGLALGLVLQIPFALAALVCARLLVTFAVVLARRLGSAGRPKLVSVELSWPPVSHGHRPCLPALALGPGERGPPLAAML